jgi:hypothetical protein
MTCGYIYKIKFPNGKHYIGLTSTSLEQRTKEHNTCAKRGDTRFVYNALRKYNMVNTFELIEIDTADTLEELCEKEVEYILEYNSYYMNGKGYNMTYGGEGTNGYVFTEEDNKKNSERQKKYYEENPQARQKMGEIKKKHYDENPEARQQMSEIKKKYYDENPEAGKQSSERMKKYYDENPEKRQQASEITSKYFEENPEARQQMSEIKKKYYDENPDAKQQISDKLKTYYKNNPEAIQKNSDAQKKYYKENPEAIQKKSELLKKYYKENPKAMQIRNDRLGNNKQFDVFTLDGTFLKTFTYQFEAKEYLQKEYHITTNISISAVLKGQQKKSAGFVFKYK